MTTSEIAAYTGRHQENVLLALKRGLLVGVQPGPGCTWRARRTEVDRWADAGCPYRVTGKHKARRKLRAA
ncbi:hypothetical protein [Prauserella muralis]|nr:hypothetical protein [Prauserella muralis]